jgi:hypothetical protein
MTRTATRSRATTAGRLLLAVLLAFASLVAAPAAPAEADWHMECQNDIYDECNTLDVCSDDDGLWNPEQVGCTLTSAVDEEGIPYCEFDAGGYADSCQSIGDVNDLCGEGEQAYPTTVGGGSGQISVWCVPVGTDDLDDPDDPSLPDPPEDDPDDPVVCADVPTTSFTTSESWFSGNGQPGVWWGSITFEFSWSGPDGDCTLNIDSSPNVMCTLQQCVDTAVSGPLASGQAQVSGMAPSIRTNPEPRSIVTMDTWLWDESGSPGTSSQSGSHPQAPVTAVVTVLPSGMEWDLVENTRFCSGPGVAWTEGATTYCSYAYRSPSAGTGPAGEDHYRIRARWRALLVCTVSTGGGGTGYTLPGACGSVQNSPWDTHDLPVIEAQAVNVPDRG